MCKINMPTIPKNFFKLSNFSVGKRKLASVASFRSGHTDEVCKRIPKYCCCANNSYSTLQTDQDNMYESMIKQKHVNPATSRHTDSRSRPGRHRFHKEVETALNQQICIEFDAAFVYLAMSNFYGRTEIALPGCQGLFMQLHQEEHKHAIILTNYILMRGGHPLVPAVASPESKSSQWADISKALATSVELERTVKEKLEAITELSEKYKDYQLVDFLSNGFLKEQNKSIRTLARLLTRSRMATDRTGQYLFDKHIYDSFVSISKDNMMYLDNIKEENTKNYR